METKMKHEQEITMQQTADNDVELAMWWRQSDCSCAACNFEKLITSLRAHHFAPAQKDDKDEQIHWNKIAFEPFTSIEIALMGTADPETIIKVYPALAHLVEAQIENFYDIVDTALDHYRERGTKCTRPGLH